MRERNFRLRASGRRRGKRRPLEDDCRSGREKTTRVNPAGIGAAGSPAEGLGDEGVAPLHRDHGEGAARPENHITTARIRVPGYGTLKSLSTASQRPSPNRPTRQGAVIHGRVGRVLRGERDLRVPAAIRSRHLAHEAVERLRRLVAAGQSYRYIVSLLGVGKSTVARKLQRLGLRHAA